MLQLIELIVDFGQLLPVFHLREFPGKFIDYGKPYPRFWKKQYVSIFSGYSYKFLVLHPHLLFQNYEGFCHHFSAWKT